MSERATPPIPPMLPGWWTLTRDICTFLGGWVIVFLEVRRPEIRDSVLVLGGSLLGVPGLALGASSIADAIRRRGGTDGPPASPPAGPSQPSSSSSSSGG